MNNKKTIKKILIGLLVAIALLVVYSLVVSKGDSQNPPRSGLSTLLDGSNVGQIEETDTNLANAEILKILGSIQHIQLNDDIFTNPVFRKLKDSNFVIPRPVKIGRPNPFLSVGYDIILEQREDDGLLSGGIENEGGESNGFFGEGELS